VDADGYDDDDDDDAQESWREDLDVYLNRFGYRVLYWNCPETGKLHATITPPVGLEFEVVEEELKELHEDVYKYIKVYICSELERKRKNFEEEEEEY
jgi:hypothetical protein